MKIITDFLSFIIYQNRDISPVLGKKYIVLLFLSQLCIGIIIRLLENIFGYEFVPNAVSIKEGASNLVQYTTLYSFLLFITAPIKEELKYRLLLGRFSNKYVIFSFSIVIADLFLYYLSLILSLFLSRNYSQDYITVSNSVRNRFPF